MKLLWCLSDFWIIFHVFKIFIHNFLWVIRLKPWDLFTLWSLLFFPTLNDTISDFLPLLYGISKLFHDVFKMFLMNLDYSYSFSILFFRDFPTSWSLSHDLFRGFILLIFLLRPCMDLFFQNAINLFFQNMLDHEKLYLIFFTPFFNQLYVCFPDDW